MVDLSMSAGDPPARDTIYALSTALAPRHAGSAIAVVRVSGVRARDALIFCTERGAFARGYSVRDPALPIARRAVRRAVVHPQTGEPIDDALILWLPGPGTATGEDMTEFHLHGGRAVVAAMLESLSSIPGLRLAEPGEFTRRAFERGKLDLTQAEGLADLVAAETEAQRRQAMRQMEGALGRLYERWRTDLLGALAQLEAEIDFPDDAPQAQGAAQRIEAPLRALREQVAAHLADRRGERLREGLNIAIVGPPNAGKSSLLNALARRDAAIVSAVAGTTRDVIEVQLDLGGYPATVADTAGLRESDDEVEREGVRRARARAAQADIRVFVVQATDRAGAPGEWRRIARDLHEAGATFDPAHDLVAVNKIDLVPDRGRAIGEEADPSVVAISARDGDGMAALAERLTASAKALLEGGADAEAPALTRARHREALKGVLAAVDRALAAVEHAPRPGAQIIPLRPQHGTLSVAVAAAPQADLQAELVAEDVRLAARALARLVGRMGVEDVLDVVFAEFCIGK